MEEDRISNIYTNFVNSLEYEKRLEKIDIDLSWLEKILDYEEFILLEEMITYHNGLNEEIMFKSGFRYAWELFNQCSQSEGVL